MTPPKTLTNWAGNLTYGTSSLSSASSLAQVQRLVKKHRQLKVLGSRHCFSPIADSRDRLLTLKSMGSVALDVAARTVTVDAGITYGRLAPILHRKGFALHNLASLPHISVAGSCATATHGSGETSGNLATAVSALELVTGSGDVVELSRARDGETFLGAVVGLGALGVITRITLDVEPTYQVRQHVYQRLPMSSVAEHLDAIQASGYSVSLFTTWKDGFEEVWIKSRTEAGRAFDAPPELFGATRATRDLHPIEELSAENCTPQLGVPGPWHERLPHFRMGFTPSVGKELQSEYFVPRRHAVEAMLAVMRLHDRIRPYLMISEVRSIAADDLWLSPNYEQPSIGFHFTWKPDWAGVGTVLPVIERELAPFAVRPHWGKLFAMPAAALRARYEQLPRFVELARRFDPDGKFRNDFLNTYVFAG